MKIYQISLYNGPVAKSVYFATLLKYFVTVVCDVCDETTLECRKVEFYFYRMVKLCFSFS